MKDTPHTARSETAWRIAYLILRLLIVFASQDAPPPLPINIHHESAIQMNLESVQSSRFRPVWLVS